MIRHCATCATWTSCKPFNPAVPSGFGSCPVEAARQTRSVFTCTLALMPWCAVCKEWRAKEEK